MRRKAYRYCETLHRYEEEIVYATVVERGSGCVLDWVQAEPGRWDPTYLAMTLGRLAKQHRLSSGQRYSGLRRDWTMRRTTVYTVTTPEQEANRAKAGAKQHAAAQ